MDEEKIESEGFTIIPEGERIELLDITCKHEQAYVTAERPDGWVDCYCPCGVGGICKSLEEFKAS